MILMPVREEHTRGDSTSALFRYLYRDEYAKPRATTDGGGKKNGILGRDAFGSGVSRFGAFPCMLWPTHPFNSAWNLENGSLFRYLFSLPLGMEVTVMLSVCHQDPRVGIYWFPGRYKTTPSCSGTLLDHDSVAERLSICPDLGPRN